MNPSDPSEKPPKINQKNPFPGLRPFREDEEFLFFGRENQVDSMVNKLAETHFLAVIGGSGSGKSSLVNCGLRPALHAGLMASSGTRWKMAQFRPGIDPIGEMAMALAEEGVLFNDYEAEGITLAEIIDTTLRMSKLGLIDIFEQANPDKDLNLLVVVDQFEELFRYRQLDSDKDENVYGVSTEATAFVNLLLAVKEQTDYPIHVVLTMRTDFLGDCTQFPGLPEAINEGQYLVPRMTRDERRAAISGPVGVGGAEISPILLTRLVNDVGDNPDQLSILQHALNRTWACWQSARRPDDPIDLPHYEAIGTMASALDKHAEKAFAELTTPRQMQICEKIFKVLTDKATDPRGVRRPTIMGALCAMAEANEAEVIDVIDVFRKPSRSFMMPPAGKTIEVDTVVDISHESLMRIWQRLNKWADAEAKSAALFRRLSDTARRFKDGNASLLRDPDLQLALDWKAKEEPTAPWSELYQGGFEQAMEFLQISKNVHDSETAEAEIVGILRIARNVVLGLVAASLLLGPLGLAGSKINLKKSFPLTDDFQNSLRNEMCTVVFLEKPIIQKLKDARTEQAPQVKDLNPDTSTGANTCNFGDLFPSPNSNPKSQKGIWTPYEENYVRPVLEKQAWITTQADIDSLNKQQDGSAGPSPADDKSLARSNSNASSETDSRSENDSQKAQTDNIVLQNSLAKFRASVDTAKVAQKGDIDPSTADDSINDGPNTGEGSIFRITEPLSLPTVARVDENDKDRTRETVSNTGKVLLKPSQKSKETKEAKKEEEAAKADEDEDRIPSAEKLIMVLPKTIEIISNSDEQVWLVSFFLKLDTSRNFLIKNADSAGRVLELSTVAVHLLMYFFLTFCVGFVYRKLEYRAHEANEDSASATEPWHIKVFKFTRHANHSLMPYRTLRWKLVLYVSFIFVAAGALSFWLSWNRVWVILIPLAVLLFPLGTVFKQRVNVRMRFSQGVILHLLGLFLLISAFWLFYYGDYFTFDPSLPILGNPWVFWNPMSFLTAGLILIAIGRTKYSLTTEELLLKSPDQPPVAYLRSFDNARQNWKEAAAASSSRFFRPKEEQILRSIFEALGPFVPVGRNVDEFLKGGYESDGTTNISPMELEIMKNSALVLFQINERPSGRHLAMIAEVLQTLKPEQVLIYFSLSMDQKVLEVAYKSLADAIQGLIQSPLPDSINSNRFIGFDPDWEPFVFGEVRVPKISFGKFLPLVGRRIDVIRARRSVSRVLKDYFARRGTAGLESRLYGDMSVSSAAFPFFGLLPSGYMVFVNMWRTGRKASALLGFFGPIVLFGVFMFFVYVLAIRPAAETPDSPVFSTLFESATIGLVFGFPFIIHWFWRRFSGREIRQHIAFGGSLQPWWKAVTVPLIGFITLSGLVIYLDSRPETDSEMHYEAIEQAKTDVRVSIEKGERENAAVSLAKILELEPTANLVEDTDYLENNPRAAAQVLYGRSLAAKASEGKGLVEAVANFEEARKIDPKIPLVPDRFWESTDKMEVLDPGQSARRIAAEVMMDNAFEKVGQTRVEKVEDELKLVLAIYPDADLIQETNETENNPKAVAWLWQAIYLAKKGESGKALASFEEVSNACSVKPQNPENEQNAIPFGNGVTANCDIDLNPATAGKDFDPLVVTTELASNFEILEGTEMAQKGEIRGAVAAFNRALKLNPKIDLNPQTQEQNEMLPEAVALVWYGEQSAEKGHLSEAMASFEKARLIEPGVNLLPRSYESSESLTPLQAALKLAFRARGW